MNSLSAQREQAPEFDPLAAQLGDQRRDTLGLCRKCLVADTLCQACAARKIGVSRRSLYRLIQHGELKLAGSTKRLSKRSVLAFCHGDSVA